MTTEGDQVKADLLKYSYEQVLDATKHQDDKVGRLLTTIAFLTAASLALAALGGAKVISVPVNLGGDSKSGSIAIGFVCLLAFIIGVIISVIQLIGSISTPLRLPGLDPIRRSPQAHGGASTLYFYEIEKSTREEWAKTWEGPSDLLRRQRSRSLVGETHNLAQRTSFKYARTNEAQAILTWALIALSLTAAFVTIIVLDETQPLSTQSLVTTPVTLDPPDMLLLGTILAGITLVWSVARMRHSRLGKEDNYTKPRARLQLAIVMGCTFATFWAAGLPGFIDARWPELFRFVVGFVALFATTSMSWMTWEQTESLWTIGGRRLVTTILPPAIFAALGCASLQAWEYHDWHQGLPWALGVVCGSLTATTFARTAGHTVLMPHAATDPTPPHAGPALGCPACRQEMQLITARRVKWRVITILTFGASLSFIAQNFHAGGAYAWPLAAACAALTLLIGAAAVEPSTLERRERAFRAQRRLHAKELQSRR